MNFALMLSLLALVLGSAQAQEEGECIFPDLDGVTAVSLQSGATAPAGSGGDIPGGRWELVSVRYSSLVSLAGQARGAMELDASGATTGSGGISLEVVITSPDEVEVDEERAGSYSASGNMLSFENDCGDDLLLGDVEYDIDATGADPIMTLWDSFDIQVDDPWSTTITVHLQVVFRLVEPSSEQDEVFGDRFEAQ